MSSLSIHGSSDTTSAAFRPKYKWLSGRDSWIIMLPN